MTVRVDDLTLTAEGGQVLLDRASLTLSPGSITAVTGPSGAGKSTLLRAVLGDLAPGVTRTGGSVEVLDQDVFALPRRRLQRFRRAHLAYVGQDPGAALNPTMRVAALLAEAVGGADRATLLSTVDRVRLRPEHLRRRPGELSGGEQRRLALARALLRRTEVLLVDEPLAGLDAPLRRDIAELLRRLADEDGVAIAVSGHHTAELAGIADAVTHLGGSDPVAAPVKLAPRAAEPADGPVLLAVRGLGASVRRGRVPLLRDVAFTTHTAGAMAVVGASGAGKTTLARVLAGLHAERTGTLELAGAELPAHARRRTRDQRRRIQLVPQDPLSTLNPQRTVGATIARPLRLHRLAPKAEHASRIERLLAEVGLPAELADRRPHALSGGQRQRVAIARALAAEPDLLICDEITSALDAATAEAIMDLLRRVRATRGLSLVLISHDLALTARHCAHVVVLDAGRIVESGPTGAVFTQPAHPATAALLTATHAEPVPR